MPLTGANTKAKDPEYCNWLKVSLALYCLKDGLSSFLQDEVDAMHQSILQKLYNASTVPAQLCSSCNAKDVKQNRNTYIWKFKKPCPVSLCDTWLTELLALCSNPTSSKLYCENCDVTAWSQTPWECAKFYMPRGQTVHNTGPAQSDSQALLIMMANCKHFHSKLSPGGIQLTHTVSKIRNTVMHSGDMTLSDNDRTSFITDIITLLEDPCHLKSLDECKKAVAEINKINTDSLEVIFNTDMEMEKKALRVCLEDLRQELGVRMKKTEETVESLKEEYNNVLMQLKEIKDHISQHDERIRTLEDGCASQRSGATADVRDIQLLFIKAYKGVQIISVNAVLDNAVYWKDLEDFYTDIFIEEEDKEESTQRKKNEQELKKAVTSFRQIFEKCDRKETRIILQAPAGQGKSTFCRKLVNTWCSVQKKQLNFLIDDGTSDRSETSGLEHEDELLRFDVLLYICLRDISDEKTLMDVVYSQFPLDESQSHRSHIETLIGQAENNKVLLIMDGLDEMDNSKSFIGKIMRRELYPNLTVLATTRSWKIGELRLIRSAHIDLLLDLQGFSFDNSMLFAKKMFDNYYKDESAMAQFEEDILRNDVFRSLIHVPLLLLFIVQVWYDRKSFPQTIHELYMEMLDVIVNRYMKSKKRIGKSQAQQDQKWPLESTTFNSNPKLTKLSLVKHFGADFLASLCEVAYHFLINACTETSLVFDEEVLLGLLGKEGTSKLQTALDLGILSKSESRSTFCEKIRLTFLHKTVQEFLAAINICCREDRCSMFLDSLNSFGDVLRNEQIIKFAAGISTNQCQKIFEKIYEVCEKGKLQGKNPLDEYRMRSLSGMYIDCIREVHKDTLSLELCCFYAANQKIWNELQSALKNALKVRIHLKYLYLKSCILNDAEFDFFEFQCLTKLHLHHMTVKGKPLLSKFNHLKSLILRKCTLDDDVLDLSESVCLEDLRLKNITMKGKLLLSKCTRLKCLKLSDCTLDDVVLDLSEYVCLEDLRLKNITMKGKLLLSKCTHLKCLNLSDCTLDDVVLDLSEYVCLEDLRLKNMTIKSKLLLSKCTHLKYLSLYNCTLDDVTLDLSECTCLEIFLCNKVTLTGTGRLLCTQLQVLTFVNSNLGEVTLDLSTCPLNQFPQLQSTSMEDAYLKDALHRLDNVNNCMNLTLDNVTMSKESKEVFCNSLSQCKNLQSLSIKNVDLCDALLSLDSVEYVDLDNVTMSKECMVVFCNSLSQCKNLQRLSIKNVDLCDALLSLVSVKNVNLDNLTMSKECTVVFCNSLSQCKNLKRLSIKNFDLCDALLSLVSVEYVDLDNVTMSKECTVVFCNSLSQCKNLKRLSIKNVDLCDARLSLDSVKNVNLDNLTMSKECTVVFCNSLSQCKNLQRLSIKNVDLCDALLSLVSVKNVNLDNLTMSKECTVVFCNSLSQCKNLQRLSIKNVDLCDALLSLVSVKNVNLDNLTMSKECTVVFCNSLSQCKNLQRLSIKNFDLCDALLSLVSVEYVDLDNVTMSKECTVVFCNSLSQCKELERLSIKNFDLCDALLSLVSVEYVDLDNVTMSKECTVVFCNSLSQCKNLQRLSIKNMDLCDALLSLEGVKYINEVIVDNVTMSKECKEMLCNKLSQCKDLERLSIKNVELCDGLHELFNMKKLNYITLEGVKMGTLGKVLMCKSLCQCTQLMGLTLKNLDLGTGLLNMNNLGILSSLTIDNVTMCKDGYLMLCSSISTYKHLKLSLKNLDLGDAIPSWDNLKEFELINVTMSVECVDCIKSSEQRQLSSYFKTVLSIEMIANSCDKCVVNYTNKRDQDLDDDDVYDEEWMYDIDLDDDYSQFDLDDDILDDLLRRRLPIFIY
ncbi:hypothetical protein ACJMK2_004048 [Sinanodonta woodiana]|uniref:NACHT domain-containing protein n=1 Tax=Sinanodonta woodiana TaxID=1069815 RepID=A0ABD3Y2N8_SINWO